MKQLFTILILGMFLSSKMAFACCAGDYVGVFPKGTLISSNSVFLIDFSEKDFFLKNKSTDLIFTAITTKGVRYQLRVLETNFSGTMGQVLLKVESKLNLGDTISIQVSLTNSNTLSGKTENFANSISYKKWVVRFEADTVIPTMTNDSIKYSTHDSRNSSSSGYSVIFKYKINDNSKLKLKSNVNEEVSSPLFYLIILENQKFICASENSDPSIYFGMCGRNFNFEIEKPYSATLKAIDASGNYSLDSKKVLFTTTADRD